MNSLSKNQLKNLIAFRQQKRCDEDGVFVVEGVKMCDEALQSSFKIITICGTTEYLQSHRSILPPSSDIYEVNGEQLERLSNQRTPNKVWMLVERVYPAPNTTANTLVLALDGLQDPGNMGTIMRTADWFGIRRIVCSHDTVSCYNPKVVQSSMGAIFRTNVEYCDLAEKLDSLSKEGFSIYGAMLDGESIFKAEKKSPSVLVIGNEGHGISEKISSKIERRLTIPNIGGTCESLNAAVATAILVSEFYR